MALEPRKQVKQALRGSGRFYRFGVALERIGNGYVWVEFNFTETRNGVKQEVFSAAVKENSLQYLGVARGAR